MLPLEKGPNDRGIPENVPMLPVMAIVVIIAMSIGAQIGGDLEQTRQDYRQAKDWCVSHGGEVVEIEGEILYNIKCELPNGTTVDPYQRIGVDYPPGR